MFGQKRVIIELDGGQHAQQRDYDKERDAWIRDEDFIVLRFWNNDVIHNIDGVMEVILNSLQNTPYLNPSPQGGRRRIQETTEFNTARFVIEQFSEFHL